MGDNTRKTLKTSDVVWFVPPDAERLIGVRRYIASGLTADGDIVTGTGDTKEEAFADARAKGAGVCR
jgi:hypothetical protein